MRNMLFVMVVGMILCCTVGCNGDQLLSNNMQNAMLNSGGQCATAGLLDNSEKPDEQIAQTKALVKDIRTFLDNGTIGSLTIAQLTEQLNKIIPIDYKIYTTQILSALSGVTVPTDKIGDNNIIRIKEVLDGIYYRCDKYNIDKGFRHSPKKTRTLPYKVSVN